MSQLFYKGHSKDSILRWDIFNLVMETRRRELLECLSVEVDQSQGQCRPIRGGGGGGGGG